MDVMQKLVVRDTTSNDDNPLKPAIANLLITLIILLIIGILLIAALVLIRRKRRERKQAELPLYDDKHSRTSNHRRLTILAMPPTNRSKSIHVNSEKQILMDNSSSPPPSPVPEIRITFPEEENDGHRKSGRVVIVRISETGSVGMEPCLEENLPPYRQTDADRFHSLDLERIGGLKENHDQNSPRWS